ncbi:hypothetical protein ARMGADRAFT_1029883 [Armillaria gallica]|uniref:Uncharacterized protein n=1 Tax=Armillaria gallica TaxID=47427 RepID=A0A2H3DJM9_ARMGA|nr:hypothetical protein ARMGADRAFT_1029883 [Armillaria gallica]
MQGSPPPLSQDSDMPHPAMAHRFILTLDSLERNPGLVKELEKIDELSIQDEAHRPRIHIARNHDINLMVTQPVESSTLPRTKIALRWNLTPSSDDHTHPEIATLWDRVRRWMASATISFVIDIFGGFVHNFGEHSTIDKVVNQFWCGGVVGIGGIASITVILTLLGPSFVT